MQQTRRGKSFRDLLVEAKGRVREITVDQLREWLSQKKPVVVVDVREAENYHAGHIPGAVLVPRGVLEMEIDERVPDQDQAIVAYCGGGSRSALAADTLQVMGYAHVYSLAGGWKAWSAS